MFLPWRKEGDLWTPRQTDFPRRDGRACRDQLVGPPRRGVRAGRAVAPRPPPLRPWEASDGSLRNFTGMTREEDTALVQFHLLRCIIPGSLRRLIRCIGGGVRFPPPPMSEKYEEDRIRHKKRKSKCSARTAVIKLTVQWHFVLNVGLPLEDDSQLKLPRVR